jgi:hypothetical protein
VLLELNHGYGPVPTGGAGRVLGDFNILSCHLEHGVITLNFTRHAYLPPGHLIWLLFQATIEQLLKKHSF